ncbi:MAG TPA: pyridoxine 5'-phosphate synthase [Rubricoccaceae bacterium]|nr:pyridoxine 5'-phosphate synthase [Rubricoccaceae bacterium]
MTSLSVNLNKVALVRNARGGARPSVRWAAETCLRAGAHGITLHPRPDRRHALPEDVFELASWLPAELNVEGNPFSGPEPGYPGFMEILRQTRPAQATLVPDAPGQRTSDHGWDLARDGARVRPLVEELRALGCRVSLFMDPDPEAIARAADVGADRVELYTGPWAEAFAQGESEELLARYVAAAERANAVGLGVNAGHDLDLNNLGPFLRAVPGVREVSIGHALTADALERGLEAAVRAYLALLSPPP